jgi:hypothetical protein
MQVWYGKLPVYPISRGYMLLSDEGYEVILSAKSQAAARANET